MLNYQVISFILLSFLLFDIFFFFMHMLWPSPWVSKKPLCWELPGFKDVNNFIDYYHHSIRGWSVHKVFIFSTVPYFPLLNNINKIDSITLNKSESDMTHIVLHGNVPLKDEVNLVILNVINDFVFSTNRFDEPIYLLWIHRRFSFSSWLYGYRFKIFEVLIFAFRFFVSLAPIIVMVPGDNCFYV